jgi:plastocyanin
MTTDDETPIIRTTTRRLAKGLAIVVGVMIVGAVIGITQWEHMHAVPPPSAKIKPQFDLNRPAMGVAHPTPIGAPQEESKQGSAGASGGAPAAKPKTDATLTILEGAATQGNPDFQPDELKVKKGNTILVENHDLMPHTVTNGKGASDATSGKLFDTSIINGGEFKEIKTANVDAGSHPFYCTVHPYMTGTLVVQ